ncbi:DUF1338 domain-containing protein [Halomonas sp. HNIBRBA4712]|uniref:DUF1338 domain-containing protein n=1 Tax=Halomonas sp. HNIBRBA4712 TaxID=3373087 RepID=UPI003746874F
MHREEFERQLWLDYIHTHPDLGGLGIWPLDVKADYLTLLTLNHGPFSAQKLTQTLHRMGYVSATQYALADKGLIIHLLGAPQSSWLILVELQLGALCTTPRDALLALIEQSHPQDCKGHNLLCRGRPWPMPSWALYQQLEAEHPLAAWLAAMGPRLHHAGFSCQSLGEPMAALDKALESAGMQCACNHQNGVFPVSSALEHHFYPAMPQKVVFSQGDEHRLCFGGLALAQKVLNDTGATIGEELLPPHTKCEMA